MAIAAVFAAALSLSLPPVTVVPGASIWFATETRPETVTFIGFLQHVAMAGTRDSIKLNCVTWSLVQEARIMLIFPLLALAVLRRDLLCLAVSVAASLAAGKVYFILGEPTFATSETWLGGLVATINFVPDFVLGMVLAKRIDRLKVLIAGQNLVVVLALWAAAYVLIRCPRDVQIGTGAALLLLLCLSNSRIERVLSAPILQWLGKISYSLYLIHIPIIAASVYTLHEFMPIPVVLACALAASLSLAELFHQLFTEPSAVFGKACARFAVRERFNLDTAAAAVR